jgi:hypothetical protein
MPLLLRQDNFTAAKRPNCNTGEPCGGACIDPNEQCNVELPPQIKAKVEDLRNSLLGTVPGIAEYNTAKAAVTAFNNIRKSGTRGQQAMYLGAVLVGASLLGYSKYREKYREGFPNSAEVAQRRAKGMANSIPDIGGKQNIIFAVDSSLSKGDKGRGGGLADELMKDAGFAAKYHVTSIKQNAHENPKDMDSLSPRDRKIAEAMVPIKQALQNARNGQSDAAVELASQMLAYNEKHGTRLEEYSIYNQVTRQNEKRQNRVNTGLQLNVIGHGDGGMVASEAMEILKRVPGATELANRINVIGLNTPDGGLTDTVGKVKTIASRNSPVSLLPMKNKVTMDAPDGEGGRAMLRKKEVRQFIDGHFGGSLADVAKPAAASTAPAAKPAVATVAPSTPTAAPKMASPRVQWTNPQSIREPAVPSNSGVAKTTTFSSGQQEIPLAAAPAMVKSSVARQILSNSGADELIDHQKVMKANPNLSQAEAYQVSSLGGLPTRLKNEYIEGKVGLPTALEIAREVAYDDFQKRAYMKQLIKLRSTKPDAGIDPKDYLTALKQLRGDSFGSQLSLLKHRIDALKLRVA